MGAAEFNGTGANTSRSQATSQPALAGGGLFTVVAAIRPDSAGQSNLGTIFSTATSGAAGRASFTVASAAGGVGVRLNVVRALTNTVYISNDRPLDTTAGKHLAIVAAIFDDSASPKVRLFSTCASGPVNDGPIAEHTYGTSNNGTGAVSGSDTTWTAGNVATVNGTLDGLIAWLVIVPASLTQNQLEALAAGVNPVAVVGGITNARVITFVNGAAVNLLDPAATWTDTALTFNDAAPIPGGEGFAPGVGRLIDPIDARSGTGTITATSDVTGSGTAARSGTSSLSAASAVSGTGSAARRGTSTVTATSSLTGDGGKGNAASGAINATTTVTGSGIAARAGAGAVNTAATVTGSGSPGRQGSSTISATSGTTGSGMAARLGSGAITASSSLTGDGGHGSAGDAAITATATVTGSGTASRAGSGAITATATITASGTAERAGTVTIAASSTVVVVGEAQRFGTGTIGATSGVTGEGIAEITGIALDIDKPGVRLKASDRAASLATGRRGLTLAEGDGRQATRTP